MRIAWHHSRLIRRRTGPFVLNFFFLSCFLTDSRAVNEATRPGRGKPGRDEAYRGSAGCDRARRGATGRDEVRGVERSAVGAAARWYAKLTAVKRIITPVVQMPWTRVGSQKEM
jgi:hypothetical protein